MIIGEELGTLYRVCMQRREDMMRTTGRYLIQERELPINPNLDEQYRIGYEIIKVLQIHSRFFTTYEAEGYYDPHIREYYGIVGEYETMLQAQKAIKNLRDKLKMIPTRRC